MTCKRPPWHWSAVFAVLASALIHVSVAGDGSVWEAFGLQRVRAPALPVYDAPELSAQPLHADLRAQQQLGLPRVELPQKALPPSPGGFAFLTDSFERNFPGPNWHLFHTTAEVAWHPSDQNFFRGSHSLRAEAAPPVLSDDAGATALSWLISVPYDLRAVDYAVVQFEVWLNAPEAALFFGVSTDGRRFYGYGLSGRSRGWQSVSLNLNRVPGLGQVAGRARRVWFGLFWGSRGDGRVYVDDLRWLYDAAWRRETAAVLDGRLNPNAFTGGIGLARPAFADIDADGDADLFVGEYDGHLNFYRNDGSAAHPKWTYVTGRYADIDVGENSAPVFFDLDRDGDLDLFVGHVNGGVRFFRNEGTKRYAVWRNVGVLRDAEGRWVTAGKSSTPAFVDVDRDGDPDLLLGNLDGRLVLCRNEPGARGPAWKLASRNFLGVDVGSLSAPTAADADGDGVPELFVGQSGTTVLHYRPTPDPARPFELASKQFSDLELSEITAPAFTDLNGDGAPDLCVGQASGELSFFANRGAHRFEPMSPRFDLQTLDLGFQCAPTLVDLDADGDLDLVTGNHDGAFWWYRNVGRAQQPEWKLESEAFAGVAVKGWSVPTFVDIDADGDLDLFSGSKSGRIAFFENVGDRRQPKWRLVSEEYAGIRRGNLSAPEFADLDGDGRHELFVGSDRPGVRLYRNVGSRRKPEWRLEDEDFLGLNYNVRSVPRFYDFDRDGDLDLFVGSRDGTVLFFENRGSRTRPEFHRVTNHFNEVNVRFFSVPALGDVDADGDPDLFVGGNSGGLNFWRNQRGTPSQVNRERAERREPRAATGLHISVPRPLSPSDRVRYEVIREIYFEARLYSREGRELALLERRVRRRGRYRLNLHRQPWPPGVYWLRLSADGHNTYQKLVLFD